MLIIYKYIIIVHTFKEGYDFSYNKLFHIINKFLSKYKL